VSFAAGVTGRLWSVADIVATLEISGDEMLSGKVMNWEYSVELISFIDIAVASKALNKWGRDGWEVAAIIPGVGGKEENWTVAILKRPVAKSK
jgi:hypothetical protein